MSRTKHPNKDIEAALKHAEDAKWRVETGGSHAWGKIYCPYNDDSCRCGTHCITSIWSTPKNPGNFSKQIRRIVDNCKYEKQSDLDNESEDSNTSDKE